MLRPPESYSMQNSALAGTAVPAKGTLRIRGNFASLFAAALRMPKKLLVVVKQGKHVVAVKFVAAVEKI